GTGPPIAEARHRAYPFRSAAAERASDLEDRVVEQRFADIGTAPDRGDQLVSADRAVAMLDQIDEAIERTRRKLDRAHAVGELARPRRHPKPPHRVAAACHRHSLRAARTTDARLPRARARRAEDRGRPRR